MAANGLRYTNFHSTALCSPTRAALITGRNHHSVGFGVVSEAASGYPGYDSGVTGPRPPTCPPQTRPLKRTVPLTLPWDETFDIGSDTGTPVDDRDYKVPFRFTRKIAKLVVALDPPRLTPEDVKKLQEAAAKAADRK